MDVDPTATPADPRTLWYRSPADDWSSALPVGNGRLGAMVFGRPATERIQLNEECLWAGGPIDRHNPAARAALPEVRRLLEDGEYAAAEALALETMVGDPGRVRPYQTAGTMTIEPGHDPDPDANQYRRELRMRTGIARTVYEAAGRTYRSETFASATDNCVITRIVADEPGAIDLTASLARPADARTGTDGGDLVLRGRVIDLPDADQGQGGWGVRFEVRARITTTGGTMSVNGDAVVVTDATAVTIATAVRTDATGTDPTAACLADLDDLVGDYHRLRSRHVATHREPFERVQLDLGAGRSGPTDERLAAVADGASDPDLLATYVQFGRYLLQSSSRPGGLPANLQGIWCEELEPPWACDFHTNINLQMNYWPAEPMNLPGSAAPLVDFVEELRASGSETAARHYGCDGWVLHHLTDPWGTTTPADGVWGIWPMGAAWLCRHLWTRYEYSLDEAYLATRAFPVMRDAARFLLDFLVEDDDGRLVTNPSYSPEQQFLTPAGEPATLTVGATMDLALTRELFEHCLAALDVLDPEGADSFRDELTTALDRLASLPVADGVLQEWIRGHEPADPGHRHLSHLYPAYPGDLVTERSDPALLAAANAAFEERLANGSGNTGWSRAWCVALAARFGDGDAARDHLRELLSSFTQSNLMDVHPPDIFQIDGNLGAAGAFAELIVASHDGAVQLLPALPDVWRAGSVAGVRARGGFEVDVHWTGGEVAAATVRSRAGADLRLRSGPDRELVLDSVTGSERSADEISVDRPDSGVLALETRSGETLRFRRA